MLSTRQEVCITSGCLLLMYQEISLIKTEKYFHGAYKRLDENWIIKQ